MRSKSLRTLDVFNDLHILDLSLLLMHDLLSNKILVDLYRHSPGDRVVFSLQHFMTIPTASSGIKLLNSHEVLDHQTPK